MTALDIFNTEFTPQRLAEIFNERILHSSTVGKDGVHPLVFAENLNAGVQHISDKAHSGSYRFTTFKQKLVLKGHDKPPRQISVATVRDRVALRAVTNVLMSVFPDARILPAHYIVEEVAGLIAPRGDDFSFIQIDIKNFYPSVRHDELLRRLRTRIRHKPLLNLIMQAVGTPTSAGKEIRPNTIGIPQGLSISNVLSSIYMMKFDEFARSRFAYFRYVDDILIVCPTADAKRNFRLVRNRLAQIGLECHRLEDNTKTKIVPLSKGVDYLGFHLAPEVTSVRTSSYRRIIDKVMTVMTGVKYSGNHARILARLNLKITGCIFDGRRMGWMFFFSMTDDLKQLQRLDGFISKTWRRLGMEQFGTPKRFVKAYHEINFNLASSRYIPRFDEYSNDQKVDLIATMLDADRSVVANWAIERINRRFLQLIRKEVAELEKDITPIS
ncbi:reverse transcriptase domain-containing protein [Rhizobium sp. IBUN]|uniref:reverse transcriptase domain-containing protein n=1 Tax=Rhizobium sp. IBUN TaxID=1042326 RepID=UPI00040CB11F|nr:reverse transcriptase domain-containing protein [Rhizobium sp. IBUN]